MTELSHEIQELKAEADNKVVEAAAKYAHMLYTGENIEQNFTTALHYYEIAANGGNKWSEYMLGVIYQYGQGTEINYQLAHKHYVSASMALIPLAIFNLGVMAQLGIGQEQDAKLAAYYYERAANLKNANAALNLGQLHHAGLLDEKPDYFAAEKWYKIAIELGNLKAQIYLNQVSQFTNLKAWSRDVLAVFRSQKITFWDQISGRR